MTKPVVPKKAAVQLTAGTGFRNENSVAARFLLDLLAGSNTLGADFGRISRIHWQGRDLGWLADDLVVACSDSGGDRSAGISIKSAQQVTGGGFPANFVGIAWAQWLGVETERALQSRDDTLVLMTGSLAHDVADAWSNMLGDALRTTPDRMVARLAEPEAGEGSQSSAIQRALFESLHCPDKLKSAGDTGHEATVRLLCHIRLLSFDFEATTSHDHGRALRNCQEILRSGNADDAARLWSRLIEIADARRAGGSIDLAGLLAELRDQFDFRDHPDYRRDWESLHRSSQDAMADVRTQVADLPPLARDTERAEIEEILDRDRACFLVGESGSGKSALAKQIAETRYGRCVWFADSALDYDNEAAFERGIDITHPFPEIVSTSPKPCLIVFDSIERYSARARRLAHRFMQAVLADDSPGHVHVLVTGQFEPAEKIIRRFIEAGLPPALHKAKALGLPTPDDIWNLVAPIDELQWLSLRPELRPLLTNLKILDWVAAAARSGRAINPVSVFGVTHLIDALWDRWIEGEADQDARSYLLMRLGILEGDTLAASVPRIELEHGEQATLGSLTASDLVRVREQRVRFSHDLLGDLARLNVLIGDQNLSAPAVRERASRPRWHRAMRLYGQRLLEQSDDGPERWRQAVDSLEDDTPEGAIIRDLLLEALFLATNAVALLIRSWPVLSANNGRLLKLILERFMFAATLPDPRIELLVTEAEDRTQLEPLFRLPYWPYWGPMLTVLHTHRDDVVRLAPHAVAKLCVLWLKSTPAVWSNGRPVPWRQEAAELAIAIGREIQARNAEDNHFSGGGDKPVYEAVLAAAPDLPDEVAELCLELAQRHDVRQDIATRAEQARERRREEARQYRAAHPERRRPPYPPTWPAGELRDPWPDGPRGRVQSEFQAACMETGGLPALARVRPDAALEILLAVCIEEPQHEQYGRSSMPETGIEHWRDADPPLYGRGPFLQLLQQAPDHGLTFVLRLINFATRRFSEGHGLTLCVGNESRVWCGDNRVFRWHHDWPVLTGSSIHCALMALERWLYEQIDRGENIEPWINRILRESESLAFAGLLFDVGKRDPTLFVGRLKPLLRNWWLVDWDRQISTMRASNGPNPMGYWANQPAAMLALGRDWYRMPHRSHFLIYLGGGIVDNIIADESQGPFLAELRAEWATEVDADDPEKTLLLLIERFNPDNYTFELRDGKRVSIGFEWPESIAERSRADLQRIGEDQAVSIFPYQCRRLLVSQDRLSEGQLPAFWQFAQSLEALSPRLARDGEALHRMEDLLCGAIAVLVIKHDDWLAHDPDRMVWCRSKLDAVVRQPPERIRFGSEATNGDQRWDAFAAEAGVALLARDTDDLLARTLVARGVLSFHYSTTGRTLRAAFHRREQLGHDFDRMLGLAVRWAGLRPPYYFSDRFAQESGAEDKRAEKNTLIAEFVDRRLPVELPDIRAIDARTDAEIDALRARRFPEVAHVRGAPRASPQPGEDGRTLRRGHLSLDTRVISEAFSWLVLGSARPEERAKWLGFIRNFLDITLGLIPDITDTRRQATDDYPDEFDSWVFDGVARAIPCLTAAEDHHTLWQPLIDRGAPAHKWIERFAWEWFTTGVDAARSPEHFVALWSAMISHALQSPAWDPTVNRSYELRDAVFWLLGLGTRINKIGQKPEFAAALASMEGLLAQVAERWFKNARLVAGFLHWVTQPSAAGLLVPATRWLAAVIPSFDTYDWKDGLEQNLVSFLHTCWEREQARITANLDLERAFNLLMTTVVSRGGHPAIALRDHVVRSVAG
jgi:hypothetical protein